MLYYLNNSYLQTGCSKPYFHGFIIFFKARHKLFEEWRETN